MSTLLFLVEKYKFRKDFLYDKKRKCKNYCR